MADPLAASDAEDPLMSLRALSVDKSDTVYSLPVDGTVLIMYESLQVNGMLLTQRQLEKQIT